MPVMKTICCILSGIMLIAVFTLAQHTSEDAGQLFEKAGSHFEKEQPTEADDSIALLLYGRIADLLPENRTNAAILFTSLERAGILEQTAGNQTAAIALYKRALSVQVNLGLGDSLAFKPNLYLGNAYYFLNNYDSAIFYFRKAEILQQNDEPAEEQFRLYNSLGALYFEGGNFRQSINYFHRALQLLTSKETANNYIRYALQSNIASALRQMHLYDSSLHIYQSILRSSGKMEKDALLLNISNIFLEKKLPDSAQAYLSRISKDTAVDKTALLVRWGRTKLLQQQWEEADEYLHRAIQHSSRVLKSEKNVEAAEAYRLLGDAAKTRGRFEQALEYYQAAIIQSDYHFNEPALHRNPETFFSSFGSFSLFENLLSKAQCLAEWKRYTRTTDDIALTIATYQSAFALLDWINKSYDNEQARLFVGQAAAPAYADAVQWLLGVYQEHQQQVYLETLLQWTERNKAVALLIGSRENRIKWETGIPDTVLQEENSIRNLLSQLRHQQAATTDSSAGAQISAALRENEVRLSRLISRFNDYPAYYQRKYAPDTIHIKGVQSLLPPAHAIVSFFHTGDTILCFRITSRDIALHTIPRAREINSIVQRFTTQLHHQAPGTQDATHADSKALYDALIHPLLPDLFNYKQLVIIPHRQLGYLPFEALRSNGRYLLEDFIVSYQQALAFLQLEKRQLPDLENGLIMAPFPDHTPLKQFPVLPASREEVEHLQGLVLYNEEASRQAFIGKASGASLIHLATHAVTDNDDPAHSHIAFYPKQHTDSVYKLYATDIVSIPLHQTQLLFLSACETATGRLQEGEGILSLSRAFAEAGCSNMVTSLWKAEDRATAYISQRFYHHLKKEKNYALALRNAKLDMLRDAAYPQFSHPSFWSHLVYIGNIQELPPAFSRTHAVIAGVCVLLSGVYIARRFRKKR